MKRASGKWCRWLLGVAVPKPPGREISIISDWGSGIKLSADEDGLPEKIGFFLVGPTFSSWLNLKVRTHGNQQNLLTVCLWKTTSQFHRFFEISRIQSWVA